MAVVRSKGGGGERRREGGRIVWEERERVTSMEEREFEVLMREKMVRGFDERENGERLEEREEW